MDSHFTIQFLAVFFICSGPFIASYLALVVTRGLTDKVINSERRSQCLECGQPLSWYDLVPILSFAILRGKCRYCRKPIPVSLLMSELLGGLVYAGLGIHVLLNFRTPGVDIVMFAEIIVIAVFFATMLYLAIYDIQTFSVPSRFVTVLLVGSIAVSVLLNSLRLLGGSLSSTFPLSSSDHLFTGLLLGLLVYILILLTKQRGMGEGDIYIAAVIGLYLGWPNGLMAMYFAIITGGIFGLFYALKLGKVKNVLIPFVPFLLLGSVISIIIGSELFRVVFYG